MIRWLFLNSPLLKDLGLLLMRVALGFIFIKHGSGKFAGGPQTWKTVGSAMHNLGINFAPAIWGLAAASTELFGGSLLVLGLFTRVVAALLSFVMIMAFLMHINKGDPFATSSHPLSLLFVFLGLMIAGGGAFALDTFLARRFW